MRTKDPEPVAPHFSDVDRAPDPTKVVDYLDSASKLGPIQRLKQTTYELLDPRPGQRLLDVGCGTGDDVRAIARFLEGTGWVVGVDSSLALVAEAFRRSAGGTGESRFCRCDACRLPFPDASFDGVRSERMLQHLRNPRRAVAEMVRVLKPGGRMVDFDPDWEMVALDADDPSTTRKIVAQRADALPSGTVGRKLFAFWREAGLEEVTVMPQATLVPSFEVADRMLEFGTAAKRAAATGGVTSEEAAAWIADLRQRDASGRFFCGLTGYLVAGRKPGAGPTPRATR